MIHRLPPSGISQRKKSLGTIGESNPTISPKTNQNWKYRMFRGIEGTSDSSKYSFLNNQTIRSHEAGLINAMTPFVDPNSKVKMKKRVSQYIRNSNVPPKTPNLLHQKTVFS